MSETVIASTNGMAREEWLNFRKQGVGGSDASAVAGFNRYKSPLSVWAEKVGQFEPEISGEAAYWGTALEDLVAKEFSIRENMKVRRSNKMYKHPKHPYMIGNVDRLIQTPEGIGVLECKTASAYKADEWEDGQVPDEYMIQIQHYLEVLNLDFGYFAVLIGGNTFKTVPVKRNRKMGSMLIELESEFWTKYVIPQTPPPVDGSQSSSDLLGVLYPNANKGSEIELTSAIFAEADALRTAKEGLKLAESAVKYHENQIKAYMGDHEVGVFGGEPIVTWKSSERTTLDTKQIRIDHPSICENYLQVSSSRRFLLKPLKGE